MSPGIIRWALPSVLLIPACSAKPPVVDMHSISHDTSDAPITIDPLALCDGSAAVKIRFAFFDGETPLASEPMMAKQGNRYLVVDGTCTFYAYDDAQYPLYQWTPVVSGHLEPSALMALAADLDLDAWAQSTSTTLEMPDGYTDHLGRVTFSVEGHEAECSRCTEEGLELLQRAYDTIEALYSTAAPFLAPTLEALVFPPLRPDAAPGWSVPWGAAAPPEAFIGVRGLEPTVDLGVPVAEADHAWFADVQAGFQGRDIALWPRQQDGVDIVAEPGATTASWELYVRSVVP